MKKLGRLEENFIEYATALARSAARSEIELLPFAEPSLKLFASLPEAQQITILTMLRPLAEAYEGLPSADGGLEQIVLPCRRFLASAQLSVAGEVFTSLEDGDSVDIYNSRHQLIFASLNFFGLLSYSLEEVLCTPWNELYTRDSPHVEPQLAALSQQMLDGVHAGIVQTNFIDNHVGYELRSLKRRAAALIPRFFAPVLAQGRIAGYLCVTKCAAIPGEFVWE